MPFSTKSGESITFTESLFTTTSAVCVTGLSVIPDVGATFSVFGKIIIAILIEIGGLSFLTIAIFVFALAGVKLGLTERFLMREALNQNSVTGIIKLVIRIVKISLSIQFIGFILNIFPLLNYYDNFWHVLGYSAFHTISSFNNAGFDLFGSSSLIMFKDDVFFNITTMLLIILGGLGFNVIYDIIKKRRWKKLSIHTRIVLPMTLILIVTGTVVFKFTMNTTFLEALFQSVTSRTAGFATMEMTELSDPSYITMLILMLIGASPCSTGGGLKTTTLFTLVITIIFLARGKKPHMYHRSIATSSVFKAFSLVTLALSYIVVVIFILTLLNPTLGIKELAFETVSAFGTVGLSMSVTPSLSIASRFVICLTMLFGRLGPLTVISLWNRNWLREENNAVRYVEEKIIIG